VTAGGILTDAVMHVAAALEAAGIVPRVYTVLQPGYATLTPPFVAVDAPSLTDWTGYLSANPSATVDVPVRVSGKTTADGPGILELTDAAMAALHDAGVPVSNVVPVVAAGQGVSAPMPVYVITATVTVRP